MRVGVVGAGWIAEKAAITLSGLQERERHTGLFRHKENAGGQCECYAIASRSLAKAQEFASRWNVPKAYGSYEELIADPDVDLVYVATPHSHHYDVTCQAILAGKPCLVEKAFMANHAQAEAIVKLAHERKVFLAEAIWTRYQPAVGIVRGLIDSGRIGTPRLVPPHWAIQWAINRALCAPTSAVAPCSIWAFTRSTLCVCFSMPILPQSRASV